MDQRTSIVPIFHYVKFSLYETTGWLGLMEREMDSSLPDLFPSAPGMVFPLYHVFADLAEWKSGSLVVCSSNRPLSVAALAVESSGSLHLLAVNLAGTEQREVIGPFTSSRARICSLCANIALHAMFEPERFRQGEDQVEMQGGIRRRGVEAENAISHLFPSASMLRHLCSIHSHPLPPEIVAVLLVSRH
jgi:hypothetical protein